MKKILFALFIIAGFASCKKCYTCTDANLVQSKQCFTSEKQVQDYEQSTYSMCQ
ncbi:MAG TPA: hypothetical protein VG603_15930 [Chitinophagales bacterium]|nr:hypothetical protein [Chitinophagales bacterium]